MYGFVEAPGALMCNFLDVPCKIIEMSSKNGLTR